MSFKECVEGLGYSLNTCNAITEPRPSLLAIVVVVALAILIGLKAYKHRND